MKTTNDGKCGRYIKKSGLGLCLWCCRLLSKSSKSGPKHKQSIRWLTFLSLCHSSPIIFLNFKRLSQRQCLMLFHCCCCVYIDTKSGSFVENFFVNKNSTRKRNYKHKRALQVPYYLQTQWDLTVPDERFLIYSLSPSLFSKLALLSPELNWLPFAIFNKR